MKTICTVGIPNLNTRFIQKTNIFASAFQMVLTIQKPDILVWFFNGIRKSDKRDQFLNGHFGICGPDHSYPDKNFCFWMVIGTCGPNHSKTGSFDYRICLDHSKTGLARYLNAYCTTNKIVQLRAQHTTWCQIRLPCESWAFSKIKWFLCLLQQSSFQNLLAFIFPG